MDKFPQFFNGNMCFICHLTVIETELKNCSSCKLISYCSKAHQSFHWKEHKFFCKIIQSFRKELDLDYLENTSQWDSCRFPLILFCELIMGRKLEVHERNMILYANCCGACQKRCNKHPCLNCLCVNYCSEEHKKINLVSHQKNCDILNLCRKVDLYLEENPEHLDFTFKKNTFKLTESMEEFIKTNIEIINNNIETLDCKIAIISQLISCPLSLLHCLIEVKYAFKANFMIHVVGCSFLEINFLGSWETIVHAFPEIKNLEIHFVGPEVKENFSDLCSSCTNKITFKFFFDFYHDYVKKFDHIKPDIICCFNPGFYESNSWLESLPLLVKNKKVPLVLTSFTEDEIIKDTQMLREINKYLKIDFIKNKYPSLRPFRDMYQSSEVFFNNAYAAVVLNDT